MASDPHHVLSASVTSLDAGRLTARQVRSLQRITGNQVAASLLQRQGPALDPAIEKAEKSGDPNDIDAITDFAKVSEADRIRFIGILVHFQGDAHGRLPEIWRSFADDDFERVLIANRELWDQTAGGFGGPLEVMRAPLVEKVRAEYQAAIQQLAGDNLTQNATFVGNHMQEMGLESGDVKPLSQEAIDGFRRSMQGLAWDVWSIRQSMRKLTGTVIGHRAKPMSEVGVLGILMGHEDEQVWFDPHKQPGEPELLQAWAPMKDEWDRGEDAVTKHAAAYPEIYELVAAGDDDALLNFSRITPDAFKAQQQRLLQTLLDRIHHVSDMVARRDLDLMSFRPAEQRLAAGGGEWAGGFKAYMADELVKQHEGEQSVLKQLADLGMDASIMLDVIGLPEIGIVMSSLAAGLNLANALSESKEASGQAEAARATPLSGTEMVDRAAADDKEAKASADLIAASVVAIIAAIAAGAAGGAALAEKIQMSRLQAVVKDEALLARMLAKVSDKNELYKLVVKAEDPTLLDGLLDQMPASQADAFLGRLGGGETAKSLLTRCKDPAQLGRLLDRVPNPEQLNELLGATTPSDLPRLEEVLKKIGDGAPGTITFNVGGEFEAKAGEVIINPCKARMPVETLRSEMPDNLVVQAGAERIPFPDGCGKAIVGNKLENQINWDAASGEFRRVLAPGGTVEIWVTGEGGGGPLRQALARHGFRVKPPLKIGDNEYDTMIEAVRE